MPLKDVDVPRVAKLILRIVESATCFDCLRYFIRPERATCGHVLCHHCWLGRRLCPCCKAPLQRRLLKPDANIKQATDNARNLVEAFEKLFEVSLDEFVPMDPSVDSSTSSENHPSAPPSETRQSYQDILSPVHNSTSNIQIQAEGSNRTSPKKVFPVSVPQDKIGTEQDTEDIPQIHAKASSSTCPKKVILVSVPQDDWDKIETAPDIEDIPQRNNENIIQRHSEPFTYDVNEFSNENPHRSTPEKVKAETTRGKSPTMSEAAAKTSNNSTQWSNYIQESQNENNRDHVERVKENDEMIVSNLQTGNWARVTVPFTTKNSDEASTAYIKFKIKGDVTNKQEKLQHKEYTDKEVQTCIEPTNIPENHIQPLNINTLAVHTDNQSKNNDISIVSQKYAVTKQQPAVSTEHYTRFAATATVPSLVTERFEKNLSNIMECEEGMNEIENVSSPKRPSRAEKDIPDNLNLEDIDVFKSGSVKEHNVQMFDTSYPKITAESSLSHKNSKLNTQQLAEKRSRESDDIAESISKRHKIQPSEKNKTQKLVEKRSRELDDIAESSMKRRKIQPPEKIIINDNEVSAQEQNKTSNNPEYNELIGLEFVNIDADIEQSQKQKITDKKTTTQALNKTKENTQNAKENTQTADKSSENMFSTVGNMLVKGNNLVSVPQTQQNITNLLNPGTCLELAGPEQDVTNEVEPCVDITSRGNEEIFYVYTDEDDSHESLGEEMLQKNDSGHSEASSNKKLQVVKAKGKSLESEESCSISEWIDSVRESTFKSDDDIENPTRQIQSSEISLTMNRFVDSVTHSSTPVKSNPQYLTRRPLVAKKKRFCLAGSCLSQADMIDVMLLCLRRNWAYVENYRPDLTHLVVGVTDNKSERSVKYMCALAAGKWIVSPRWVEECLETNTTVNEEPYEVLDLAGKPGPCRSRLADSKIFTGFTFFCLPPFSIIDLNTLESLLQAAGARVAKELREVKVTSSEPCLLLCESENTEEDRCIDLALQHGVVPVDYNWALNCLGDYALRSLYDYLQCPAAELPQQVQNWSPELILRRDGTQ